MFVELEVFGPMSYIRGDPRDLLKLYLYGYLNKIRSSRRLEAECRRNVELMWLLGRLCPDHKSIAEFRRIHRDAVSAAGVELVRFAKSCGLIRGEWIAIDGTKFRAVASIDTARERFNLQKYLDAMECADEEQQLSIDTSAVQAALEKLKTASRTRSRFHVDGQEYSAGLRYASSSRCEKCADHSRIRNRQRESDRAQYNLRRWACWNSIRRR